MALQMNFTDPNTNVTLTNAYIKISEVRFRKGDRITIFVGIYTNNTDQDAGKRPLCSMNYSVSSADGTDWTDNFEIADLDVVSQNIIER